MERTMREAPARRRLMMPGAVVLAMITILVALVASRDGAEATCKCFVPNVSATYSDTSPGSHPDVAGTLDIGLGPNGQYEAGQPGSDDTGDYNFAGIVTFLPSSPADADVPNAAILGSLTSQATLAILNNPCTSGVQVPFTFMEATTDINDVVHMLPFGTGNELAVLAGDNPPFEGSQAVKPPPVVTHYPSFLNAIFDPDWVDYGADKIPGDGDDNNGPAPPIRPRFRAAATTFLSFASLWVILQQVVFEPGTKLPNLPAFDPAHGYPSVTVLQTSSAAGSATPPIAGPITDFCTPLKVSGNSPGVSQDNPDTGANEGGVTLRTLPNQPGTPVTSIFYAFSQRDADGDGYENTLDPCPFSDDSATWNPRGPQPQPGDDDPFAGQPSGDGLPDDTCDPDPNSAAPAAGGQPTDYDGDGYPSRGDNCPLIANGRNEENFPAGNQKDTDRNAAGEEVGDGIGDACDPAPATPDGAEILCIRTVTITVGGPGTATVSNCLNSIPPPPTTSPTSTPTPAATPTRTPAPTPTPTQTPEPNPCRGATGSSATTSHDISLDGLAGAARIRDSQAKTYTAIVTNHNLTGAEDIQVCFSVVPMFGCSAPEIDVALPYDDTPGEPDNLFVDVSGDGVRDSLALAVARGILPGRSARVKATVFFSSCPPPPNQQQTPFDYIVQVDACHEGDPAPKGFFGACTGIAHSANDPNQNNDAPIQKAVNDAAR